MDAGVMLLVGFQKSFIRSRPQEHGRGRLMEERQGGGSRRDQSGPSPCSAWMTPYGLGMKEATGLLGCLEALARQGLARLRDGPE